MVAFGTALKTATTTTGIKFGATYWNALSTEQKAIFTSKNYTITAEQEVKNGTFNISRKPL